MKLTDNIEHITAYNTAKQLDRAIDAIVELQCLGYFPADHYRATLASLNADRTTIDFS